MRVILKLGLTYDTSPEEIEHALEILRGIVKANDDVNDRALINFIAFGDFALEIRFVYGVKKGSKYYATQSTVNLEIFRQFNAAGLEFAFPTQTIHTARPLNDILTEG